MQNLDEESDLDSEMSEGQRNGVINAKQQQNIVKGGSQGIMNFKGNTQVSSQNPSQRLDTEEVFDMQLDLEDLKEIEKPQQQQQKIETEHFQNGIQDEKNLFTQSNTKATGIKLEEKNLTTFKDTDDYLVLFNSSDKTNLQQKGQSALTQSIFQQSNETPKLKSQAGQEMKQQTRNAQSPKRKEMTPLEKVFADFKKNQCKEKYNQPKSKPKEINSILDSKAPLHPNRDIKNMQQSKTQKEQRNKQKNNQVVLKSWSAQSSPKSSLKSSNRFAEFQSKKEDKIKQLQMQQKAEQMKECSFKPKTMHKKNSSQGSKQFLKIQQCNEAKSNQKPIYKEQSRKLTRSPSPTNYVCKGSQKILKNSASQQQPFYQRLYHLKQQEAKSQLKQEEKEQHTYKPNINARSRSLTRNQNIQTLLYEDAVRRQQKQNQSLSPRSPGTRSASPNSQHILKQRLKQDIKQSLQEKQ